jgi:hypothetical protein
MKLLDLLTDPVRLPLALALLAAVARVLYAIVSHVVAPYPRARAAVEAVVALLPDVLRSGLQLVAVVTGRPAPRLDVVPVDPDVARAQRIGDASHAAAVDAIENGRQWRDRALAAEARVAELTASPDGGLRPTVVPGEEPERSPDETTAAAQPITSRHRIRGAL